MKQKDLIIVIVMQGLLLLTLWFQCREWKAASIKWQKASERFEKTTLDAQEAARESQAIAAQTLKLLREAR